MKKQMSKLILLIISAVMISSCNLEKFHLNNQDKDVNFIENDTDENKDWETDCSIDNDFEANDNFLDNEPFVDEYIDEKLNDDDMENEEDSTPDGDGIGMDMIRSWTRQFGSEKNDIGYAVAKDSNGNIYVAGKTTGAFDQYASYGMTDIFLIKYSSDGNVIWSRQFGSALDDEVFSMAVKNGSVYITGYTALSLSGSANSGGKDIVLIKITDTGSQELTMNIGTESDDFGKSVNVDDSGNIYISGYTYGSFDGYTNNGQADVFLIKLFWNGSVAWIKQWGTDKEDKGLSLAVAAGGNVYVSGSTDGSIDGNMNNGGKDIFISKFKNDGTKIWTLQKGTDKNDESSSITLNNIGNFYVTGTTDGSFDGKINAGGSDVFLSRYNSDGVELWANQFGSPENEYVNAVITYNDNEIFMAGSTNGSLGGNINAGRKDGFLIKFNSDGTKSSVIQWGTKDIDEGNSVSVDDSGNIYVTGYTTGQFQENINTGGSDIFLTKFNNSMEKLWTRQTGSLTSSDFVSTGAIGASGDVFLAGYTSGSMNGNENSGGYDIFLEKFNNDGTEIWTKQWGTGKMDFAISTFIDSSDNIFIAGLTYGEIDGVSHFGESDIFITKLNSDGAKLWTKQFGTGDTDIVYGATVDESDSIFIAGGTQGPMFEELIWEIDAFVMKLDSDGTVEWGKQFGTKSYNYATTITTDFDGNVYVAGIAYDLSGNLDFFLSKFDTNGVALFEKEWGTEFIDNAEAVFIDNNGNVFIAGTTYGSLNEEINTAGADIFLKKMNRDGTELWTKQYGTQIDYISNSAISTSDGSVFITGSVYDNLTNPELFLKKINGDGTELWTEKWGTQFEDYTESIFADKNDNIFITGHTKGLFENISTENGTGLFLTKFEPLE
jgi:uncharacterized delta-60 repeat protein